MAPAASAAPATALAAAERTPHARAVADDPAGDDAAPVHPATRGEPADREATEGPMPRRARPVLVVGGTLSPDFALAILACRLRADGFAASTMALGGRGLGDIGEGARALAARVEAIRAEKGAARVDLVAHSQGGLQARYYVERLGGAGAVGTYVSLGTPHRGSVLASLGTLLGPCRLSAACRQMAIGSEFLGGLDADAGGELDPAPSGAPAAPNPVRYVAIYTALDGLVQPFWSARLPGARAENVLVQSHCPLRAVNHLALLFDGAVYGLVRSALRGGEIETSCLAF